MSTAIIALMLSLLAPDFPGEAKPGSPGARAEAKERVEAKEREGSSPATPEAPDAPDASDPADPASDDPYAEQAPLDVDTILADTSRAYLQARARLEEHPELAAEAILDRLATVPPPTSTDRKRLLDVLAALGLPDHVELFAQELRRAVLRADSHTDKTKALTHWLPLMIDQGPLARPPLLRLVGDQKLPLSARAALLDALVEVTPAAEVDALVPLVGRGARSLRGQLYRSLRRRASREPALRQALLTATDTALTSAEPERIPALIRLRGAVSGDDDEAFTRSMGTLARDPEASFGVRVAALRALAGRESSAAHEVLTDVARRALPQRSTQRGEILAWLALQGLPPERARDLVKEHRLVDDDAPRLATLGFAHAPLAADQAWLPAALDNPWPQVRQAAMARVRSPCVATTEKLLEHKGHLAGRKSEDDRAVARSAIQALGRCESGARLRKLLADGQLDIELRSESARQLARLGDDASIQAIGAELRHNSDRAFARRLASALRHMPRPTAVGDALLCEVATRPDEAGHAARESLLALHGDLRAACE